MVVLNQAKAKWIMSNCYRDVGLVQDKSSLRQIRDAQKNFPLVCNMNSFDLYSTDLIFFYSQQNVQITFT